jgi:hypothetical protein
MGHFDYEIKEADDNFPGVHLPGSDESAEIPGEGIIDQGPTVPDLIDDDVNVGIDFDSHKPQDPAELVQQDNDVFEPVVVDTLGAELGDAESLVGGTGDKSGAPSGVRRAARERKQVKNYKPGTTGKKYAFAAMELELAMTELGLSFFNLMHLWSTCPSGLLGSSGAPMPRMLV